MRSGNPVLSDSTFLDLGSGAVLSQRADAMSLNGTLAKIGILLFLTMLTAAFAWSQSVTAEGPTAAAPLYLWGGVIGGFVLALVTTFKKEWAPVTAPLYAILEGFFLGAISGIYAFLYQGIVIQAVMLTFGTLFALLFAYRSGMIKVTDKFRAGVVAATGGIVLIYLATLGLGLFDIHIPYIHESGLIGIGFSLVVVTVAALNLVLDFDLIETGISHGAPKYMEWFAGFALLVTLVWLYIEFLRLLSKLRD